MVVLVSLKFNFSFLYYLYAIVRNKSKCIVELLSDSFKLRDEKKKFSSWSNRIEGVASGGITSSSYKKKNDNGIYGSTSSES